MVMLEIKDTRQGKCCWCGREREVLTVIFVDKSLSGPMCWNDLRRALRMKIQGASSNGSLNPPETQRQASGSTINK